MDDNTNNTQQQPTTPTPEASGDQGGERTFTQEEVNRIVSERLARERARTEPTPEAVREADLRAREHRLACREFITEEGYPQELLEILDTSDSEKFKAAVQKLDGLLAMPSKHQKPVPRFIAGGDGGGHAAPRMNADAMIGAIFSPPKI